VPVARWPVDRHAAGLQPGTGFVDVVDAVGEVTEIAASGIGLGRAAILGRPVVGQLNLGSAALALAAMVLIGSQEKEGVAPAFALHPPGFLKAQQFEEAQRRFGIADPQHGVKIVHDQAAFSLRTSITSCAVRVAEAGFCPVTILPSRRAKG